MQSVVQNSPQVTLLRRPRGPSYFRWRLGPRIDPRLAGFRPRSAETKPHGAVRQARPWAQIMAVLTLSPAGTPSLRAPLLLAHSPIEAGRPGSLKRLPVSVMVTPSTLRIHMGWSR